MLMKLKLVFSPELIRKIIIIFLAILIASISTSFSFRIRKAYGDEPRQVVIASLKLQKDGIQKVNNIISALIKNDSIPSKEDRDILVAELKKISKDDSYSELTDIISILSKDDVSSDDFSSLKGTLTKYVEHLLAATDDLNARLTKLNAEIAKAGDCTGEDGSPCVETSDLLDQVQDLKAQLEEYKTQLATKNHESEVLRAKIVELEKSNKEFVEKIAEMEKGMFETIVGMQTQIVLTTSSPEKIVELYHQHSQRFVGLFQLVKSFQVATGNLDEKIDDLKTQLEVSDLTSEKRSKLDKELKSATKDKEGLESKFDGLQKAFELEKTTINVFRNYMEQNKIDPRNTDLNRGTRMVGPDGQVIVVPSSVQEPTPMPVGPQTSQNDNEIIRNMVIQQLFGANARMNTFNNQQQNILNNNVSVPQYNGPIGQPQAPRQGQGQRGSQPISAGNRAPIGNGLMDLVQYGN